jgi:Zn-dependent protease
MIISAVLIWLLVALIAVICAVVMTSKKKCRLKDYGPIPAAGPMEQGEEIICALAGPVAGAMTIFAWKWFPELAVAGLVQTIFNLIPIYPLDGGRVARNICCKMRDLGVQ